ncbi:glycine receptor subunit alpha-2-like [Parasteatoda tepidariorum]|uniref:glycine receptor subunit alpha-2-like n=1 Tax=Parasteatoda tepidariorum TaxID=114398 RepID=UPI0039BD7CDE
MMSLCLISLFYLFLRYITMIETCMEDCKDKSKLGIMNVMPLHFVTQIPQEATNKPLEVYTEVYLEDLNSFRPVTMDFRLDFFLKHHWKVSNEICLRYLNGDDSISVRPSGNFFGPMTGNSVILKAKEVKELWLPDTYIGNSKIVETPAKDSSTNFIVVKRTGKTCLIDFTLRLAAIISCQMDFRSYPVDIQVCPFILRSFSYPKEMVVYVWDQEGPPPFNPEMRMLRHRVSISKGKSEIHMLNKNIMTWPFWKCNGNSVKCIGMSGNNARENFDVEISSLMKVVYHCIVPFSSHKKKLKLNINFMEYCGVDIWMVTCMCFVFASLLEFTLLIKMEKKRSRKLQKATDILSLASSNHSVSGGHKQIVFNNLEEELGSRNHNLWKSTTITLSAVNRDVGCRDWPQTIDKLSRYFFPMAFLLFNAFYWPILLSR